MRKITMTSFLSSSKATWRNSSRRLAFLSLGIILSFSNLFATNYCSTSIGTGLYVTTLTATQTGAQQTTLVLGPEVDALSANFNIQGMAYTSRTYTTSPRGVIIDWPGAPPTSFNIYFHYSTVASGAGYSEFLISAINGKNVCVIAGIPTLATTAAATSITGNTAVSGGNITDIGGSTILTSGVCWGTATGPTVALATKTTDGPLVAGTFTSNITGLTSGVKYYVRSYATNTQGTAYGAEVSFTTSDNIIPTGFTAVKGAVTTSSVELLLNATDNSGSISYSISYGSTPTVVPATGVSGTQKSVIITGLTAGTDYSFSVTAKDAAGNEDANNPIVVTATTVAHPVAPVPPARDASTVIGVYSDTYMPVANAFGFWYGTNSSVDVVTSGNNSKLMSSTGGFGIQFTAIQDASLMKYLHVDVYPTTVTTMQIGIVAPAGTESHPANTLVANQWNSFDISLADLKTANGAIDLSRLAQIGFWGMNGAFYLDNVYFWTDVAPSLVVSTAVLDIPQPATSTNTFDITTTSSWTVESDQTWLTPSSASGTGNATITLTATTANPTYEPRTATVTIVGGGITRTIAVTQTPIMPVAAPTPIVAGDKVISVYSDTYTDLPTVMQNWYGNTFSTVMLADNTTLKNASVCCFGYEFTGGPINVSGMTKLHVDIYPLTLPSMTMGITGGGEFKKAGIALTADQWNSVDVLLSELTGANLASVAQIGFWDLNGTFYLDNLYFYNDLGTSVSEVATANGISCYPNPVTDRLTINAKSEISQVIVRNLLGQSVKSVMINGLEKSIDLSTVSTGNYFVTVKLANGQLSTQKIVKL